MSFARIASVLLLFCTQAAFATEQVPLRLCYEDIAAKPWTLPEEAGLNAVLLKRVEKVLGERFIYVSRPWKRCLEEMRRGDFDGIFAAADSEERRTFGVFPTLPNGEADPARALHEDVFQVFLRKDGAASWDGKLLQVPSNGVLVQRGYVIGGILRERGFDVREVTNSAGDGLRQLAAGMFDVAVLQGLESEVLLRSHTTWSTKVTKAPMPYATLPMYLFVGTGVYERDPKRIEAIWASIATIRKTPAYRAQETKALRQLTQLKAHK